MKKILVTGFFFTGIVYAYAANFIQPALKEDMDFTNTYAKPYLQNDFSTLNNIDQFLVTKGQTKPMLLPAFEEAMLVNSTPMKNHKALVRELGKDKFEVAADVESKVPSLIDMNLLTYAMGRDEEQKIISITESLAEQGWELRPFKGFSGKNNRVEDIPGFVGYNRYTNEFTVILRGSHTREGEVNSADWEVNLDAEFIDTPYGKMHKGFYNRTTAMMDNILEQLKSFYHEISIENRKDARIIVSGHSQGAALATLVAARLAEDLKGDQYLGRNFDNTKSNTIVAYLLSAPRVVDQNSREWIHNTVGKQNIIRQNVTGLFLSDPVPSGSPGKTFTRILKMIPFVGDKLAQKYGGDGGAASVGYLAADMAKDALSRQIKEEGKALSQRTQKRIGVAAKDLANDLKKNPAYFFKLMAPAKLPDTLSKVIKSTIADTFSTLVSPLHYGGTKDQFKEGAYFQPSVVAGYSDNSPSLAEMLEQGTVVKKKGFKGFIGRLKALLY